MISFVFTVQEEEVLPEEVKQEGAITARTYTEYFKAGHSAFAMLGVLFLFVACQVMLVVSVH